MLQAIKIAAAKIVNRQKINEYFKRTIIFK